MRYVKAQDNVSIPLGRQGENNAETVQFDVKGWSELYGVGAYEVFHMRSQDTVAYPCVISVTDTTVDWLVGNADVEYVGEGEVQIVYVVNDVIAKSKIFRTCTKASLDGSGEVPEPYENRIQDLIDAAANITVEANRAETAREGAETAQQKAEEAQGKAEDAQGAAETAQGKAKDAEEGAKGYKEAADAAAVLARSWAEGGTGTRQGEDTDNAEYWAGLAEQRASEAGYVWFDINDEDGCMYVIVAGQLEEDVEFEVNEELGILEVIYT